MCVCMYVCVYHVCMYGCRASWKFSLFLEGGSVKLWGSTLLKIIICIQSGTLLGNNLGVTQFFLGGGDPPQNRHPGSLGVDGWMDG